MKKNLKKRLALIFCALLLSSSFISCSTEPNGDLEGDTSKLQPPVQQQTGNDLDSTQKNEQTEAPSQQIKPSSPTTSQDIEKDKYEAQISYYMELTESLQSELVKLKEEAYIDECEYKLQIESLEETIGLLEATVAALSTGNKQPTTSPDAPSTALPDYDPIVSKSDFKYTLDNGQITITGYNGKSLDVEIPSNIDGFPVTDIGEGAFQNTYVRSVVVPSSVRRIDWFAFSGCTCLESITLPSSVLSIEYGAFDYCPKTMTVKCEKGSYAEAYAKSWGIKTEPD